MPTIKKFTGLNNVAEKPELAGPGDLQTATNVICTDDGMLMRRSGFTSLLASTDSVHSLNTESGYLLYVENTSLMQYADPTPTVLRNDLTANLAMRYLWLNGNLYFSNGAQSGVYRSGAVRSFGLSAPPQPIAYGIAGGLLPGKYQVAYTYVRSDGQESGASTIAECSAPHGGIRLANVLASADTDVTGINVYISTADGETLYSAVVLGNVNAAVVDITNRSNIGSGALCNTLHTYPPPAHTFMFFYRGRAFYVSGSILFCSMPMMFENVRLENSYWTFQSAISFAVPVELGIWIGTETELMFLYGKDPFADGGFEIRSLNKHHCLIGGQVTTSDTIEIRGFDPRGLRAIMPTGDGIFIGDGNGQLVNYTGKRWKPPSTTGAFGIIDSGQYVFSSGGVVYSMNIATGAVCQAYPAYTSMAALGATLYGSNADGIFEDGGADDDGTDIAVTLEKQGVAFGSGQKAMLTEMYLHMASAGTFNVAISSDVGSGTGITPTPASASMRNHRVKLPRGVAGRNFTFNITNNLGADMSLAGIETLASISQRRI